MSDGGGGLIYLVNVAGNVSIQDSSLELDSYCNQSLNQALALPKRKNCQGLHLHKCWFSWRSAVGTWHRISESKQGKEGIQMQYEVDKTVAMAV